MTLLRRIILSALLALPGILALAQSAPGQQAQWKIQKDSSGVPLRFILLLPDPPSGCICPLARPPRGTKLKEEPPVRRVILPDGGLNPYPLLECRYLLLEANAGQHRIQPPILPRGPWKTPPEAISINLSSDLKRHAAAEQEPVASFFGDDWASSKTDQGKPEKGQSVSTQITKPSNTPRPEKYLFRWRQKTKGLVYEGVPVLMILEHGYPATNPMRYDQIELPIPRGAQVHVLEEQKKKKARFSRGMPWWPVLERLVIPLRSGPIELPSGRWRLSPLKGRHAPFEVAGETLTIKAVPLPSPLIALGDFHLSWQGGAVSQIPSEGLEVRLHLVGDGYWPPDRWPLEPWMEHLEITNLDLVDKGQPNGQRFVTDLSWRFRLVPKKLEPEAPKGDLTLEAKSIKTSLEEQDEFELQLPSLTIVPGRKAKPKEKPPEPAPAPEQEPGKPIQIPSWVYGLLVAIILAPLILWRVKAWRSQSAWERRLSRLERLASAKTVQPFYQGLEEVVRATLSEMLDLGGHELTTSQLEHGLQQAGIGNVDFENFKEAWSRIQGHLYGMGRGDRRQMDQDLRFFRIFLKRLEQKV